MNIAFITGGLAIVMAGLLLGQCVALDGKNDTIKARDDTIASKQKEIDEIWKVENQALALKLDLVTDEINSCHVQVDELGRRREAIAKLQQQTARDLAQLQQRAMDEKAVLFNQYREALNARPKVVVQGVADGWDPVVLAGMRQLKCVQLRSAASAAGSEGDVADCGVSDDLQGGGSGLAGDPSGADYPRPTAEQQLEFLSWAWELRYWGAKCYAAKRAIAESQLDGSKVPP